MFTHFFNVRAWADYDRTKSFTTFLVNGFKRLFVPRQEVGTESFEDVAKKMNLSESDLEAKQKALLRLSLIMVGLAIAIFLYLIYQLIFGSLKAAIVCFVVSLIALVLAFKYHFWYFQIKNKKLGCTIEQWYKQGLMGEKE